MTDKPNPFPKGSENVRWDMIEGLYSSYMVGICDEDRPDWMEQYHSLSDDEREVLKWKMEEGDSAVRLLMEAMKAEGANSIAELGRKGDSGRPASGPE